LRNQGSKGATAMPVPKPKVVCVGEELCDWLDEHQGCLANVDALLAGSSSKICCSFAMASHLSLSIDRSCSRVSRGYLRASANMRSKSLSSVPDMKPAKTLLLFLLRVHTSGLSGLSTKNVTL
jgi:hypothetical protein